jgi:hypothetical protein
VAVAPGVQENGVICSDGAGGMYVAWGDARDGAGLPFPYYLDYAHIRLLRLTAQGDPYPGWPVEGLVVSAPSEQQRPSVVADGAGGVYVSHRDLTISVTHVRGDGTFAPGWTREGVEVSTLFIYADNSRMVLDGGGGVFVKFEDLSNSVMGLQHVLASGIVDPLWPSAGRQLGTAQDGDIVSDGAGGCYATYRTQLVPFGPSVIGVNRFSVDGVVPVKLAEGTAEAEPGRVHLVWSGVEASAAESHVERRSAPGGEWQALGTPTARGRDALEYDDLSAEAGARYDYRLVRGSEVLSEEVSVTVPAAASFALAGATPNPAPANAVSVSLSLTGAGAARLEVYDLAGRREYARALTGLAPGHHAVALADARLTPGVHWVHLSEGTREAQARIVVVR